MVIKLGPAGTGGSSEQGFIIISKSGLKAVEIEFTYSIWMKESEAVKIRELNKKLKLELSIHAPYFINLNSKEKTKIEASKKRILKCCEIGNILGAKYIVFHAGFYQGMDKEQTFQNIKKEVLEMQKIIKQKRWNVLLCPETTGKPSQFGSLEELKKLKKETNCSLCVDFAHLYARENGKTSYEEIVKNVKNLGYLHCHFSGIEYTEKGERRHLLTKEDDIKKLLKAINSNNLNCTIINESPEPFKDSLKTKKIMDALNEN